ncbi:hypothetical protein [Maridesulfovibrio sp.]|uniref:hypothetical protein n=1 Tax=Maridesulfovibrio sp. TaxID=2795000 RepID=UPI002A186F16|nr:hypothetical protein [Maridesulfovibrio sp.]
MKKILLVVSIYCLACCYGCVGEKIAKDNLFYSPNSPSLKVEFNNDIQFVGKDHGSSGPIMTHTYFYSSPKKDGNVAEASWVELMSVKPGWYLNPKHIIGDNVPNSGVFTKNIDNDQYYCRIFITKTNPKGSIESFYTGQGINLQKYATVRLCNKMISDRQKVTLGYAAGISPAVINQVVGKNFAVKELTQKQIDYFNNFDAKADSSLSLSKADE